MSVDTNITDSIFNKFVNPTLNGGAVYFNTQNANFYLLRCVFEECQGSSGGAIFTSVAKLFVSNVCGYKCSNTNGYGYFALLNATNTLNASFISSNHNTGYAATTRFHSAYQTITNINTTHNSGQQESAYLTSGSTISTSKFVQVSANSFKHCGYNFYLGQNYYASYVNYLDCTITNPNLASYIQIHRCTGVVELIYFYVNIKVDSNYAIAVIESNSASIDNSYFPGGKIFNGALNVKSNVRYTNTNPFAFEPFVCIPKSKVFHTCNRRSLIPGLVFNFVLIFTLLK
jgi:hypothetical protein